MRKVIAADSLARYYRALPSERQVDRAVAANQGDA